MAGAPPLTDSGKVLRRVARERVAEEIGRRGSGRATRECVQEDVGGAEGGKRGRSGGTGGADGARLERRLKSSAGGCPSGSAGAVTESEALAAFARALDWPGVEPVIDFFSAGGDSRAAAQVASDLHLPLAFVMAHPTARSLSRASFIHIEATTDSAGGRMEGQVGRGETGMGRVGERRETGMGQREARVVWSVKLKDCVDATPVLLRGPCQDGLPDGERLLAVVGSHGGELACMVAAGLRRAASGRIGDRAKAGDEEARGAQTSERPQEDVDEAPIRAGQVMWKIDAGDRIISQALYVALCGQMPPSTGSSATRDGHVERAAGVVVAVTRRGLVLFVDASSGAVLHRTHIEGGCKAGPSAFRTRLVDAAAAPMAWGESPATLAEAGWGASRQAASEAVVFLAGYSGRVHAWRLRCGSARPVPCDGDVDVGAPVLCGVAVAPSLRVRGECPATDAAGSVCSGEDPDGAWKCLGVAAAVGTSRGDVVGIRVWVEEGRDSPRDECHGDAEGAGVRIGTAWRRERVGDAPFFAAPVFVRTEACLGAGHASIVCVSVEGQAAGLDAETGEVLWAARVVRAMSDAWRQGNTRHTSLSR